MNSETEIKKVVKENYADIAIRSDLKSGCTCGCGCGSETDISELTSEFKFRMRSTNQICRNKRRRYSS
jgi:hypothetical protein